MEAQITNTTEQATAEYSHCQQYLYQLTRTWDEAKPPLVFIGMNPNTATEESDDPETRWMRTWAKAKGYGGIIILNIFAFRTNTPIRIAIPKDPVGPANDTYLKRYAEANPIFCWGRGSKERGEQVAAFFKEARCFGISDNGQPKRMPATQTIPYEIKREGIGC